MRYAIIIGSKVNNIVIWDGVSDFDLPEGMHRVSIEDTEWCDIGSEYREGEQPRFIAAGE